MPVPIMPGANDIEARIGQQLERATLDDLLIPSFSYNGSTHFDVDIVQRIIVRFLQQNDNEDAATPYDDVRKSNGLGSPTQTSLMKVTKLVDSYLAAIAPDTNLKLSKFVALAELLPEYARVVGDGLYKAIDIYLKAHPYLTEIDRKKLCKLLDVQKLSQDACTHAAQNERLPVQIMLQVLCVEQLRLRAAMNGAIEDAAHVGLNPQSGGIGNAVIARDNYASVRHENRELKLEVARMRMRLTDLEKDHVCMRQGLENGGGKTFFQSVSNKFSKFVNPFAKSGQKSEAHGSTPDHSRSIRRRRHSMS